MKKEDRIKYLAQKHKELESLLKKLESQKGGPREQSDVTIRDIKKTKLIIKDEMVLLAKQTGQKLTHEEISI